jgi:hypothetical protein
MTRSKLSATDHNFAVRNVDGRFEQTGAVSQGMEARRNSRIRISSGLCMSGQDTGVLEWSAGTTI